MAAKKNRSRADSVEEFDDATGQADTSGVIEYDPDAESSSAELDIQAAEESAGTTVPEDGFLKARDALVEILGGFNSVAAAVARGVSAGAGLGMENIQAVGVGIRTSSRGYTGELAVKVYVTEKAPLSRLHASCVVPEQVNGYPTDVEEIGEISAFVYKARYPRPVPCGVSCGEIGITAGTIGCLVVLNNNRLCILSNNHVLANVNAAPIGSPIVQPGPIDGGRMPGDRIGILERFVPINFPGPNLVDAAAAWTAFSLVKPQHVTYSMNPNPIAPSLNLTVMKNGRTTQATMGVITGIGVNNVRVNYGSSGTAVFNDQVIIQGIGGKPFSAGGDSGSVIVSTNTRQPVALLFAGSSTHTIANPIGNVRSQLGISRFIGG